VQHHGFQPILQAFAEQQTDPKTNKPFAIEHGSTLLRAALFAEIGEREVDVSFQKVPAMND